MQPRNYFSSLCIANLGVDPTIAILFFLFLPEFFFLKFLLHLVCIVLDAISISLSFSLYKFRPTYLSIFSLFVKIFLIPSIYATEQQRIEVKDLFIAKGEQLSIDSNSMTRFSVGNKEVIKYLYRKSTKKIYIKGKSIGFSDLVIWSNARKKVYHIYVLSKKEQLKKMQVAQALKRLNLNVKINGSIVLANGEIQEISHYHILHKIKQQKIKNLILNISMTSNLRNHIFEKIYNHFYNFGAKKIICSNESIQVYCSIESLYLKSKRSKQIIDTYSIIISNDINNLEHRNYLLKFKIIQVESLTQESRGIGLSQISVPLLDLIKKKHLNLLEGKFSEISDLNIKAKLLAEPQAVISPGVALNLSLGGEVPHNTVTPNLTTTNWRFYGLKIKAELLNKRGLPFIKYKSTLTTPAENSIEGTKGSSGVYIKLLETQKLFEIGHHFNREKIKGIPLLEKIPLLKYLFSQSDDLNSFKQIICYITLEETL